MTELSNNCTDKRLIDWSDCAWAHEVTHTTSMTVINTENHDNVTERVTYSKIWNDSRLHKSEALFISFSTMTESKTFLLLTALDLVLAFNDFDDGWEFFGEMTHQQF